MRSQDTVAHFRALYIALAKSTSSAPRIAQLVEHLTVVVTIGYQIVIGSIPISGTPGIFPDPFLFLAW